MDLGVILIVLLIAAVVFFAAWRFSPSFRSKASKHVDKDGDGRPFR